MAPARIGKIRMKAGGAEVRVLHQALPNGEENWCGKIVTQARQVAAFSEPGSELVGFLVVGLFSDGSNSVGFRYDPKRSPIPTTLIPAYVAEVIRRDMITSKDAEQIAVDVFNRSI